MDKDLLPLITAALNGLGMRPQKLRGQNFLVSDTIVQKIAAVDTLCADLPRLEIGAGLASLSQVLGQKPGQLDLLEIEPLFVQRLQELFSQRPQTAVHHADALTFDYQAAFGEDPYIIYGNIPYNITTPLIKRLLVQGGNWQSMVLMIQKEAANRLCGGKGRENGPLPLMIEYFGESCICFEVPKDAFYPVPAVDSAVIRIKRKKDPIDNRVFKSLFDFIEAAFSLRRKTMINSLCAAYPSFSRDYWLDLFAQYGLSASVRAEACSLKQFNELFDLHIYLQSHPAVQQQ